MSFAKRRAAIRWTLAAFAVVVLIVIGLLLSRRDPAASVSKNDRTPPFLLTSRRHDDRHPLPELPATEFVNTSPDVNFVGSQVCAGCHAEQSAAYFQTAHSRAFGQVEIADEPGDGDFQHQASGRHYSVFRRDGQLWHRESLRRDAGANFVLAEYPMKYVVGSGQFARTYLLEDDGFLLESPISWYASLNAWGLSPGFDHPHPIGFQRNIDASCLFCHVGRVAPQREDLRVVEIPEHQIACERCHGPGALHVKRWEHGQSGQGDADFTIVQPARLPREEQESVCAQCHLESASFVDVRGRQWTNFRPGYALRHFVTHYRLESSADHMKVVGHVEQLRQSRCYQGSATLTCTTCHKPHDAPMTSEQTLEWHRSQCLSCHSKASDQKMCRLTKDDRIQQSFNDNCVQCHMPRSPTEAPHVASTHHRIGLHEPTSIQDRALAEAAQLVPVEDLSHLSPADRERSLGLANLVFAESEDGIRFRKVYLERARSLLERAQAAGLSDGTLCAALAQLHLINGDLHEANFWVKLALQETKWLTPAVHLSAEASRARVFFQRHEYQAAQQILEQLVPRRHQAIDWALLGACRKETGDLPGALIAVERASQINPGNTELAWVLVEFSRLMNDTSRYQHFRQRARLLDPSHPASRRQDAPPAP